MATSREMPPRTVARLMAIFGVLEGQASVWGQLRIPGRLLARTDAATTARNVVENENLFHLSIALTLIAIAFHVVRTVLAYLLLKPVSRAGTLLMTLFAAAAIAFQGASLFFGLPVLIVLRSSPQLSGFSTQQLQGLSVLFLRWQGEAFNVYIAFFGFWCVAIGYLIYRSTFLPRFIGILMVIAGIGYGTYLWPPFARAVYPYNLALAAGELVLTLWLLVFAVNETRWNEAAASKQQVPDFE